MSKPRYLLWRATLIHKRGSRGTAKNYRLVVLTSHLIKVFERVLVCLEKHGHLSDSQHGFRAFRSTLTKLLTYRDSILNDMELGNGVDVINSDFSKDFDTVETGVLPLS